MYALSVMNPEIKLLILTNIIAIAGVIFKEVYEAFKNNSKEQLKATQENTIAIVELKIKIEILLKAMERISKLESDVNAAHSALRSMKNQ